MSRRTAAVAIALIATLGLTACTASTDPDSSSDPAGDDGQSIQEACTLVQDAIASATDDLDAADSEDPDAASDAMAATADDLEAVAGQVTNDEVAALLPSMQQMFTQTADVMAAIAGGDASKVEEMTTLGEEFQDTSAQFQALCVS